MRNEEDVAREFGRLIAIALPEAFYYKIPDGPGGGLRPFDCLIIARGETFCIELKFEDGKVKAHQLYFLGKAQKNGAHTFVMRASDGPDVKKLVLAILSQVMTKTEIRRIPWNQHK